MEDLKIERCACGEEGTTNTGIGDFYIECSSEDDCWIGPSMDSQVDAITEWNRIMSRREATDGY